MTEREREALRTLARYLQEALVIIEARAGRSVTENNTWMRNAREVVASAVEMGREGASS